MLIREVLASMDSVNKVTVEKLNMDQPGHLQHTQRIPESCHLQQQMFSGFEQKTVLFILLEKKMMSSDITGNYFSCVRMSSDLSQPLSGFQS